MKRPKLSEMTVREKIGQTAMPGPGVVRAGVVEYGGYINYLTKFPFCGIYLDRSILNNDGNPFESPRQVSETLAHTSNNINIPLFVSADAEFGAQGIFPSLHAVSTNLSVGAANDPELAMERSYMWARELKTMGVNWPFGPVGDIAGGFFSSSTTRRMADAEHSDIIENLFPHMIKGVQKAGMAATAKHFPGGFGGGYRDGHFASTGTVKALKKLNKEEYMAKWNAKCRPIWKAAVEAGAMSFMMAHGAMPAMDDSITRGVNIRPGSASKKVVGLLRDDIGFDGVIVTDAVSMRNLSSAFEYEDIYVECFNAGNDVILFVRDDYFEIMEKAVADGRVTMERLDESVKRVLDLKEKLGLFDGEIKPEDGLTEEENNYFDEVNYGIAKSALSLVRNEGNMIPFDANKVKNVTIINISPYKPFMDDIQHMKAAFEKRGARVNVVEYIKTKEQLKELSETEDIIVYACYMAKSRPQGMSFYDSKEDMSTLFHSLSHGAEKTVVASFGQPSIYYNYFESADAFINAYSPDIGTMRAFVDAVYGEFECKGECPVALYPDLM